MRFRNKKNDQQSRPSGERAWRDCLEEECLQLSERCNEHSRVLGVPYHFRVEDETEALLARRDVLGKRSRELEQDIVRKKIEVSSLSSLLLSSPLFSSPLFPSLFLSSFPLLSSLLASSSPLLFSPLLSSSLLLSFFLLLSPPPSPPLSSPPFLPSPLLSFS